MIIWQSMDDLKHKLFYTNLELQKIKMKADVTLRKHKDTVQHLLNLLANAYKERDGARDQLHKLIYKSMSSRSPDQILAQVQPESPILNMYPKANLSKSKSNSEAYSHLLHCSSSVDSFDAAATPDFPNKNMVGLSNMGLLNQPFVQEQHNGSKFTGLICVYYLILTVQDMISIPSFRNQNDILFNLCSIHFLLARLCMIGTKPLLLIGLKPAKTSLTY
ncbi:hypothetical protein NC653_026521 [Populus alba x Populus x berolinensis]|uniref:Uncharacterized protein n=1 Tax=Populus alba x Populus x berolinensis TaxID=444605 RepID=A0AAD6MEP8_9ROSI|nr:hypothetical protein NC653_026521 [Populus alba x Populus x berolinensis]